MPSPTRSTTAAPAAPTAPASASSVACIIRGAITSWRIRHRIWSITSPRRRAAAVAASQPSCAVTSWPTPRAPTIRPSASSTGATQSDRHTAAPSGRFSQARRPRTAAVGVNGFQRIPDPPAGVSKLLAGIPSRVSTPQPSAGSGCRNTKRPQASVSNARSATSVTRSRQRWRLSSSAARNGAATASACATVMSIWPIPSPQPALHAIRVKAALRAAIDVAAAVTLTRDGPLRMVRPNSDRGPSHDRPHAPARHRGVVGAA